MRAVAFLGKKDVRVVEVEKPVAGDDGVVVRVHACGICGTDMHVYNSDLFTGVSTKLIDGHRIIGHEFTGEIVDVGRKARGWMVGDRVVSVHNKGGMAEFVHIPDRWLKDLYRIPPGLSYNVAATLEPFCNPVHSFHLREPQAGETAVIFGAGILGLGHLQVIKAYTSARVIVVDISPLRLQIARKLGADEVINAREADPVQEIKRLTGEYPVRYLNKPASGCDVVFECAGLPLTLGQALELVKPVGGAVVTAALYEGILPLDPNFVTLKHVTMYGSMGYTDEEAREALDLIGNGRVQRDLLVTHTFPLAKAPQAFQVQGDAKTAVKVLLVIE